MLCDIQADFISHPIDPHLVEGSLQLSQLDDRNISDVRVELIGVVSYLCPTFHQGNNFMDPERPAYTHKECEFLNLSCSLGKDVEDSQSFRFQVPQFIDTNDMMKQKLSLNRSNAPTRFQLPPTFQEEHPSYLQTLFVPWKEPQSKARVDYVIKATVVCHRKPGVGRILGSSREKSFRKSITVQPISLNGAGQTLLPRYSGARSRHWHREPCNTSDGLGGVASVYSTSKAKLSLLGDTMLTLEKPLLFCLELNKNGIEPSKHTIISFDLVRIISTKIGAGRREVERRGNTTLSNVLRVTASPDQVDDAAIDRINLAYFDTTDRLLNGTICLLDSTTKQGPITPAFNFAGLTVEYRLYLHVASGSNHFSYFTPPLVIETEPEISPPIYSSVVTS